MRYRDNGAKGALLDEYERAIKDLKVCIDGLSDSSLKLIVDHETKDEDCRSIQSILTHVVKAGYDYVVYVRRSQAEKIDLKNRVLFDTVPEYASALDVMFQYNEQLFEDYPDLKLESYDPQDKMLTRWGQIFDVEQIIEHAIVHILRHRRQIERFKLRIEAMS